MAGLWISWQQWVLRNGFISSSEMSATRSNVLRLYKTLLRQSQLFSNYNFRNYAIRRIRDAFKANKNIYECDEIEAAYNEAFTTLAIIKRQVVVSDLYKSDKLVIENCKQ